MKTLKIVKKKNDQEVLQIVQHIANGHLIVLGKNIHTKYFF